MKILLVFLVLVGLSFASESATGKIKHIITFMLENRSFDHLLGYLHKINPEINGLKGTEFNRFDPFDPKSPAVKVSFDAPYTTVQDCGHTVPETMIELWGSEKRVDPAPMSGFLKNEARKSGTDKASIVMRSFNSTTLSVLSKLALEYTLFDQYYSSLPGPTLPNRMYFLAATSHGACVNEAMPEIKGYPQRTFFEDVYDDNKSFKVYFGDFPSALGLSRLRKFPGHFHTMSTFYDDCKSGNLPAYSYIEPRWFDFLEWMENSEHPGEIKFVRSGDVRYGEMLLKNIYEAVRASPAWNDTLLFVTYDEHGGLYDHVPPPQHGVPNPDGINCTSASLDFTRLGIRVPAILISPYAKKGFVEHEPKTAHYDHTSVLGTARKLLNINKPPLTERENWSATFEHLLSLKEPRTDCIKEVPVSRDSIDMWKKWKKVESMPETEDNIAHFLKNADYEHMKMPISDWQQQIINIAHGVSPDPDTLLDEIPTTHMGAMFIRRQFKQFQAQQTNAEEVED